MKAKRYMTVILAGLIMASCTDKTGPILDRTALRIEASVNGKTKAPVTTGYLPSGSQIGVTILSGTGGEYEGFDGQNYENILFSTTSASESASWTSPVTTFLSSAEGTAYAYFPYDEDVTDITAIPVETVSQTDYMWAEGSAGVNTLNPCAKLYFRHALCTVTLSAKLGTYTGTGELTALSLSSEAFATSAILDAMTGTLSSVTGTGETISADMSTLTLTTTEQQVKILAVPTGTPATITATVTIDGNQHEIITPTVVLNQGEDYMITLTVDVTTL